MDSIFTRIPQIAEDTICYRLHTHPDRASKSEAESLSTVIQTYIDELLPNHLWNRDSFELRPVQNHYSKQWLLQGVMRVGDCVDDEWLVVWILRQITAKWAVAVSVYDTDGEFLLIEAAEYLPSWITPSNATNRVWIYQSELHIIPIEYTSIVKMRDEKPLLPGRHVLDEDDGLAEDESSGDIELYHALSLLRNATVATKASKDVQDIVWRRTVGYPEDARQHIQYTSAYLPLDVARVLSRSPHLVQKAVEAFYTRDAIQLRYVHKMERFRPDTCVLHTMKMTRTAYAQLFGQRFHHPKAFGQWREDEGSREWRWRDIGMKVAIGFEILYQESKNRTSLLQVANDKSSMDFVRDGLMRGSDYQRYIDTLQNAGYFKNELPGSLQWRWLEEKALSKFVEMNREDDVKRPSFASLVQNALTQCPAESFHPLVREEDPDDWMNVDREEFDKLLSKRTSEAADDPPTVEAEAAARASKLKDLADKVQAFVGGQGSLKGALFENETDSDEEEIDGIFEGVQSDDDESSVNMTEEERCSAMDSLVPAIDPSEYGKIPSYFSNSQAVTSHDGSNQEEKSVQSSQENIRLRKPLLSRDDYDGVDSDDETESEEERLNRVGMREGENSDSEEDCPQVVGDVDVDMSGEEEDFIKFSRGALGINDEIWTKIVKEREARGAFVPSISDHPCSFISEPSSITMNKASQNSGGKREGNPNLNSFEAVMQAMEAELIAHKKSKPQAVNPADSRDFYEAALTEEEPDKEPSIESLLDEELKESLQHDSEDEDSLDRADVDYNLIKNFLESFKSQAGLAGPVGNLAGRLQPEWKLPRDNS